jgi:cellulose synthase (UDP-forming)
MNQTNSNKNVSRKLLFFIVFLNLFYVFLIAFLLPVSNVFLFGLLIFGEVFHLWQTLTYIYTIWDFNFKAKFNEKIRQRVDIFITVAGEPVELVRKTVIAAKNIKYSHKTIYILNDGFVANKDNWQEIEQLARDEDVNCITRQKPGGAKAGNINNALANTKSEFIAVFDADHKPEPEFLKETMGYFVDSEVAFVQTPQFYENADTNLITQTSWEQQELFFNPICRGKNRLNSTFMCGTNMVIRRTALIEAGGMCETNIAEDFLTSLFIHKNGWKSIYVPKVLAKGLAPEDFLSYYKQQLRWARGSLEVIFKYNPIFFKRLSFAQKTQYLASASYYLSGLVVAIDISLPLIFFYTGIVPLDISTLKLAVVFIPYMFFNIFTLRLSDNFNYTFSAIAFSTSSFEIFLRALVGVILRQKASFSITSKVKISGNFYNLISIHILYISATVIGLLVALYREGLDPSVVTNIAWAIVNISFFIPFMRSAVPEFGLNFPKPVFLLNFKKQLKQITTILL